VFGYAQPAGHLQDVQAMIDDLSETGRSHSGGIRACLITVFGNCDKQ
jgi:hypothetical protein